MIGRRQVLWTGAVSLFGAEDYRAPSVRHRYLDSATEFECQRYTEPGISSYIPGPNARAFSRRGNFLLYASDRRGKLDAWALDLKSSEHRQLTESAKLDAASLTMTPDERNFLYTAEGSVWLCPASGLKPRSLWQPQSPVAPVLAAIPDGPSVIAFERLPSSTTVHRIPLARGGPQKIGEIDGRVAAAAPRPRRASILLRDEAGVLWLAFLDTSRPQKLKTAAGVVLNARWSPDGRTIYYLLDPRQPGRATQLREFDPDAGEDKMLAPTSQFASFGANRDASVFCGASSSKAQPFVLLLVRSVRRELTICEHKSSNASTVNPAFTPDSQRVYFQSDREGKPVLYGMAIERLVEKTESDDEEPTEKP